MSRAYKNNLLFALVMLVTTSVNALVHLSMPTLIGWVPAGVALSLVLLHGPSVLPGVFFGTWIALHFLWPQTVPAIVSSLSMTLAALACWWLMIRRGRCDLGSLSVKGLAQILGIACSMFVLAALLSGLSTGVHRYSHTPAHLFSMDLANQAHQPAHDGVQPTFIVAHDLFEWLLSDAIGVVLVLPLVLYCRYWRNSTSQMPLRPVGELLTSLLLLGVTLAIYTGFLERTFGIVHTTLLVLPPAVWLALEHRMPLTLLGNIVAWIVVGIGTSLGHGPFKDHSSGLPLLTIIYSLTSLIIAASSMERIASHAQVLRLATRDSLTGLLNRATFIVRLEQALASAQRHRQRLALLFIDLDHFKNINDVLGHTAGDELLIEASQRIVGCLRKEATLARFGGDELIVMLEQIGSDQSLTSVADRIVETVGQPFTIQGRECHISASVGISRYPEDGANAADLIRGADIAMYEVKTTGRNGHRIFNSGMHNFVDAERRNP